MTAQELLRRAEEILLAKRHIRLEQASANALNEAVSEACMLAVAPKWVDAERARAGKKRAAYLSA